LVCEVVEALKVTTIDGLPNDGRVDEGAFDGLVDVVVVVQAVALDVNGCVMVIWVGFEDVDDVLDFVVEGVVVNSASCAN